MPACGWAYVSRHLPCVSHMCMCMCLTGCMFCYARCRLPFRWSLPARVARGRHFRACLPWLLLCCCPPLLLAIALLAAPHHAALCVIHAPFSLFSRGSPASPAAPLAHCRACAARARHPSLLAPLSLPSVRSCLFHAALLHAPFHPRMFLIPSSLVPAPPELPAVRCAARLLRASVLLTLSCLSSSPRPPVHFHAALLHAAFLLPPPAAFCCCVSLPDRLRPLSRAVPARAPRVRLVLPVHPLLMFVLMCHAAMLHAPLLSLCARHAPDVCGPARFVSWTMSEPPPPLITPLSPALAISSRTLGRVALSHLVGLSCCHCRFLIHNNSLNEH